MNRAYQTLTYFLTIVFGQAMSFVLLPIITHYLPPAEFGEYVLALALSALASTFGSSWIRSVTFRLYFDARGAGRTRAFFWTTALFQAGLLILAYGVMMSILPALSSELVPAKVLLAAGLPLLFGDFYLHAKNFLRAEEQSGQYAVSEMGSGIIRLLGTVAGLMAGFRSPEFLLLASAVAVAVPSVYAAFAVNSKLKGPFEFDIGAVLGVLRFGPPSVPVSVSTWLERRVDLFVLEHYLGKAVVGGYSAAYNLADRVLGGVVTAVFMMSWPKVLHAWTDKGPGAARLALTQALRLYFWLTVGPAVFIGVFRGWLIGLLGPEYAGAAPIIPLIVAAAWLTGFNVYLNRHLELKKRYSLISGVAILGAAANLGLNLVLVPKWSVMGAALATLGGNFLAGFVFFLIRDRRLTRIPYADLLGSLALAGLAWLVGTVLAAGLVASALVFIACYVLGLGGLILGSRPYRRMLLSRPGSEGD